MSGGLIRIGFDLYHVADFRSGRLSHLGPKLRLLRVLKFGDGFGFAVDVLLRGFVMRLRMKGAIDDL